MSHVKYQQEFLDSVKDEALVLMQEHFQEAHPAREVYGMDIDWGAYSQLEQIGMLKIFTSRVNDVLVGHLWVLISPNLHSRGNSTAQDDMLFVTKKFRGKAGVMGLIKFAEGCLKEDGLKTFYLAATTDNPIDPLAKRMGYDKIETKFQKVL